MISCITICVYHEMTICMSMVIYFVDEIRAEMKHLKIGEQVLAPISKHFKDNPVSIKLCYNRIFIHAVFELKLAFQGFYTGYVIVLPTC